MALSRPKARKCPTGDETGEDAIPRERCAACSDFDNAHVSRETCHRLGDIYMSRRHNWKNAPREGKALKTLFHFGLLTLCLAATPAIAGDEVPAVPYPTLPATAANVDGFVPAGWKLEAQASGDLNGDGTADLALVLRDQNKANILNHDNFHDFDSNPRMLVIAFADGQHGYRLDTVNHSLISRRENPNQDDNFLEIGIAKGTLHVELTNFMTMGGWTTSNYTYTLRFDGKAFMLIGYDQTDTARNTGAIDTLSVNYISGRYSRAKGSIESDNDTIRWHRLAKGTKPMALDQIKDGMEFEPPGVPAR
jgi:hypothetical protein